MPCESEDDAQAEKQIQVSLQRAVGHSTDSLRTQSSEDETRSLNDAESIPNTGSADTVISDALLSQQTAVCFPAGHEEPPNTFAPDDAIKPAAVEANRRACVRRRHSSQFREFHGSSAHLLIACNTLHMDGRMREKANMAKDQHRGTPVSCVQSDQGVSMRSASSPPSDVSQTAEGTATTPAVPSSNTFGATTSSTFMNPWSKFATAAGGSGFARHIVRAVLRGGNASSTTATGMEQELDEVSKQYSAPSLLNEHVAQSRRAINITQLHDYKNKLVAAGPTEVTRRLSIDLSDESFRRTSEVTPTDRGAKLSGADDKQNEFFNGIHPSRLTMISNRNASMPADIKSHLRGGNKESIRTSKPTTSKPPNTSQIGKTQKERSKTQKKRGKSQKRNARKRAAKCLGKNPACRSKAQKHGLNVEGTIPGVFNPRRGLKNLSQADVQFAIEGIESIKKRYPHLNPVLAQNKEWFFAWQEIAAVLRTHFSYEYIPWQSGFSTQLNTEFKVFRLRGPFKDKTEGKYIATKRAVLHVIDGPYFFKQAAPALAEFCRANRLGAPTYSHYLHPDGSCGCSVRVGNNSSVFGDDREGYINRTDAEEDVAKTAMNALHHGGVLVKVGAATNEAPATHQCRSDPQRLKKRKASGGSSKEDDSPAVFPRIKRNDAGEVHDPMGSISHGQNSRKNEAGSVADHTVQQVDNGASFEFTGPSARTRAGLAQVLNGGLEPSERVKVMCEYLMLPTPEYWMEGYSASGKWSARFLSDHVSGKTAHILLAPTTVTSVNGLQDCARLVEEKLFEKIYSGDIHLGDGGVTFPDPAMQDERLNQSFARLRPRARRQLETDEGLTLEEISRRVEGPEKIPVPPRADRTLSGVAEMQFVQTCGLHQDTGYEAEDALHPNAMILANTDEMLQGDRRSDPSDALHFHQSGRPGTPPTCDVSEGGGDRSERQRISGRLGFNHLYDASSKHLMRGSVLPEQQPRSPSPGEYPYVSPPPFLDTPARPSGIRPATSVKGEPLQHGDQNDEVVFVGQRTVEEGDVLPVQVRFKDAFRRRENRL